MKRLAVLALLLFASPAFAQKVELPPTVQGDVATFVRIPAKTDCAALKWFSPDPGLAVFPTDLLKNTLTAVVTAAKPGQYRLYAYGAKGDQASDVALCTIVIGGAPPTPPVPPPVPPGPVDPLARALQAAYTADAGPAIDKELSKAKLAEMLRQMSWAEVRDPNYKTAEQLRQQMNVVAKRLMSDSLPKTRLACWTEIIKTLPLESTLLDGQRDTLAAVFLALSAALGKVQ